MRVLLTTESYLPYVSGVTVSVDALARGLGARGHDVMLLAPRPADGAAVEGVGSPGPEPRYAWLDSYQLPRVAPPSYRMPWPLPWTEGLDAARAFEPEVVHAQSPFVTGLMARRIARAAGAPLVFTHHTRFADYGHYAGALARPAAAVTDAYLRAFWRACAAVIAPSEDLAAEIRDRAPGSRVEVVPTGIDVAGIRARGAVDLRATAGWPPESVVVVSLGRLAPEKSPLVVLEAVARAIEQVPAIRLLVVGGGPAEDEVRRRATGPDLAGRVHLTGPLPRVDALRAVAGGDLFAFASQTETQGLVLAEALAAGLPAIAVDGPGVGESIRDGIDGRVVSAEPAAGRVAALASAIAELAADPKRRREMASRAAGDADRFAVERRVAQVEALYASVRS
jgi:1,2-diacylglycerol 3-alpha-glucosyltransferase